MQKCFPKLKNFQTKCDTGRDMPDCSCNSKDYCSCATIQKMPCADFDNINVTFSGSIKKPKKKTFAQLAPHTCGDQNGHIEPWWDYPIEHKPDLDPMKDWDYIPHPRGPKKIESKNNDDDDGDDNGNDNNNGDDNDDDDNDDDDSNSGNDADNDTNDDDDNADDDNDDDDSDDKDDDNNSGDDDDDDNED